MGQQNRRPAAVAYFRLHMDERSVRGVYPPLVAVTRRHRSGGGFRGYIGIGDFFVSFASHEAADTFGRQLRERGLWFERTRERPTDIDATKLISDALGPRDLMAVLIVEMPRG